MPSSLSKPDLAPTTIAQRTWSTWHIAALWIGMAVCIPTYTLAAALKDPAVVPIFPEFFGSLYGYAWFVGLAIAVGVYYVLMRGRSGRFRSP